MAAFGLNGIVRNLSRGLTHRSRPLKQGKAVYPVYVLIKFGLPSMLLQTSGALWRESQRALWAPRFCKMLAIALPIPMWWGD